MIDLHPQIITDTAGEKLVILSLHEFDTLIEELEDQEDSRLFDEAKKEDDGSRISLADYLKTRQAKHG